MTFRELNKLEPGDLIVFQGDLLQFVKVEQYIRSKPYLLRFRYLDADKWDVRFTRYQLEGISVTVVDRGSNSYIAAEVLYGV